MTILQDKYGWLVVCRKSQRSFGDDALQDAQMSKQLLLSFNIKSTAVSMLLVYVYLQQTFSEITVINNKITTTC